MKSKCSNLRMFLFLHVIIFSIPSGFKLLRIWSCYRMFFISLLAFSGFVLRLCYAVSTPVDWVLFDLKGVTGSFPLIGSLSTGALVTASTTNLSSMVSSITLLVSLYSSLKSSSSIRALIVLLQFYMKSLKCWIPRLSKSSSGKIIAIRGSNAATIIIMRWSISSGLNSTDR